MGLVILLFLMVAGVLLVGAYLIWTIVPRLIRRVVGLFSKGAKARLYPELIAVALIALFVTGVFDFLKGPTETELREITSATEKTIAVLSFSSRWSREDVGQGLPSRIAEELYVILTEVPELQVADNELSFEFSSDSWEMAGMQGVRAKLGVNFIVFGSIYESDDEVSVSVALFDLANGRPVSLPDHTFTGPHSEIPQILASIRTSILEALQVGSGSS